MLDFFSLIKSLIHWQFIETDFIDKISEECIERKLLVIAIEIIDSLTNSLKLILLTKISESSSLTKMALCQKWWIPSAFRSRDKNEQKSHWIDDETRVLDFIKCDSNKKPFLFFFYEKWNSRHFRPITGYHSDLGSCGREIYR